ncbi:hypothetical protein JAAARDRAFT_669678 [Jaapia argillacea MUCL 33604]|uniref:Peptidase C14 caspase domain-containing protein n=1 Tax=Jaapia argillacea MUCL 33604 TaxID=933084 RepID=A0A067Q7B2_9AGAM|nr:hypothetical protein JAAARDRAFT_669678 [Jaapia argillacea MUCL 33604]
MSLPSLYALLIGINKYPSLGNDEGGANQLRGAVNDAQNLDTFLREHIGVPASNIAMLIDHEATHRDILDTFNSHLLRNPRIRNGDPILFYFAGRGSRSHGGNGGEGSDQRWRDTICPYDRGVGDIGDIGLDELSVHLAGLASAKGGNITVILDCCHSIPDGEKLEPVESLLPRYAPPLSYDSSALSLALGSDAYLPTQTPFVILTACHPLESAYELDEQGFFTASLIQVLKNTTIPRTTYSRLLSKLPLNQAVLGEHRFVQTPGCTGQRKDAVLFGGKALGIDRLLFPTAFDKDGQMRVEAGEMHGLRPGTQLAIYCGDSYHLQPPYDSESSSDCLGSVITVQVNAVWSYVEPLEDYIKLPSTGRPYAMITRFSELSPPFSVSIRRSDFGQSHWERSYVLEKQIQHAQGYLDAGCPIIELTSEEDSTLVLSIDDNGNNLVLDRRDPLISSRCPRLMKPRSRYGSDFDTLALAARFDMHLYHENPTHPYKDQIKIRLCQDGDERCVNHIQEDGRVDLWHDESGDTRFILQLSLSDQCRDGSADSIGESVWCSAFYFDPSDYSITQLYIPTLFSHPSSRQRNPDPEDNSTRKETYSQKNGDEWSSMGVSSSNSDCLAFFCGDGESEDTGFIKIYFSSQYANLGLIEQGQGDGMRERTGYRGTLKFWDLADAESGGRWDTVTLVVHVSRHS